MYLEATGNIRLETEKCLNRLYRGVECRTCATQCPATALSLEEGKLQFDEEACVNCGLCLSQCPTGVFWLEEWDEQKLISHAKTAKEQTVALFCGRHQKAFRKAKDVACFQVPMCLGGLTKAALFEIGVDKQVEMMLDECDGCEWKHCRETVEHLAKQVNEMIFACCNQTSLSLMEMRPEEEKGRKNKAMLTGEKACSRRDIMFRLLDAGRRAVVSEKAKPKMAGPGAAAGPVVNGVRTGRKMAFRPEWMDRLKAAYRQAYERTDLHAKQEEKAGSAHGEAAFWPSVRIRRNCTNCNMCASFCPTGALRIEVEEQSEPLVASHYFQPMLCADCRLCEAVCPIEAIVRDRMPVERPFVTQIICRGEVVPCKKCGALTYNVSSGRCYWCGSEASVDDIKRAVRLKLGKK
ncbi:MAG: 4Fe-4S binding protein [Lachnospiraceae bacterium]|nr:4Fe-4S binding protein [Lachnospiraceae bacterium]